MEKTIAEKPSRLQAADPSVIAHFRTVGRISIYTGFIMAACLVVTIYYLAGSTGAGEERGYAEIFSAHALTKKHLAPALILSGMILVAITSVITWVIVFYSTYRVAGPLYPLSKSLNDLIVEGPVSVRNRRKTDCLGDEHLRFSGGASRLQFHYDSMNELVDLALVQLELTEADFEGGLTKTVEQLQELDRLVTL